MNKKFLSGVIFGLSLGLCIGIATPMIGATNKAKDIVIKSNSFKANPTSRSVAEKPEVVEDNGMKEAVSILKEINNKLKDNSEENKQIIYSLKVLVNRTDVNPQPESEKK